MPLSLTRAPSLVLEQKAMALYGFGRPGFDGTTLPSDDDFFLYIANPLGFLSLPPPPVRPPPPVLAAATPAPATRRTHAAHSYAAHQLDRRAPAGGEACSRVFEGVRDVPGPR